MFPIHIDTSALTYGLFSLPENPNWKNGDPLSPMEYHFQQESGVFAAFDFQVGADGRVHFDPKFNSFLDGNNTATLIVKGLPIHLVTSALSVGLLPQWGADIPDPSSSLAGTILR